MEPEVLKKEKKEISWRAAEHEHMEKEAGWYVIIFLLAVVFFVIALFQKNFFFAVFIVLATGLLFSFSRRRPMMYEFRIDEKGLWIGKLLYPFARLRAFSVRERPGQLDELVVHRKPASRPHIHIPIDDRTAKQAREFLIAHEIPEEKHEETVSNVMSDFFGF